MVTIDPNAVVVVQQPTNPSMVVALVPGINGATGPVGPAGTGIYGPNWIFDGDSITINGIATSSGQQDRAASWTSELVRQSMGRINYVYNAGVAGQTSIDTLARFDTIIAPKTPDVVMLTIGTNDIGASYPMADWLDRLESYRLKCVGIGAKLIVGTIWPSDTNVPAGRSATARTWNAALYVWAAANDVQVVQWEMLASASTGGWPTGWSLDGLHPTLVDAYAQIGKFAWNALSPRVGPQVIRRAVSNGADVLANGFFLSGSVAAAPTLNSATPSTASGTLPAGTYSYKFTSRTYWDESVISTNKDAVLASTGKVTVAYSSASNARGYVVYRKGPGDADYRNLAYISSGSAGSFIDDGTYTAGATYVADATPALIPTGLTVGSSSLHSLGGGFMTEAGVRGNFYRQMPYSTGTGLPNDYFPVTVNPGEQYAISALVRSSGVATGTLVARFRDSGNVNIGQVYIATGELTNAWGLANTVVTIPTSAATMRISFELANSTDVGYADFAEVGCLRVA